MLRIGRIRWGQLVVKKFAVGALWTEVLHPLGADCVDESLMHSKQALQLSNAHTMRSCSLSETARAKAEEANTVSKNENDPVVASDAQVGKQNLKVIGIETVEFNRPSIGSSIPRKPK